MRAQPIRLAGIQRYAEANRSDPFAYNRAMTHYNSGVCGFNNNGEDAHYDALKVIDPKTGKVTFTSVVRP